MQPCSSFTGLGTSWGHSPYWDELYSQNPPIRNFVADPEQATNEPDEIWVIQLNPQERQAEPRTTEEIVDRDNELAANLSLEQEKKSIANVNKWIMVKYLPKEMYKKAIVRTIAMSPQLSKGLDFASKLDRSATFAQELMTDDEMEAKALARLTPRPSWKASARKRLWLCWPQPGLNWCRG